MYFPYYIVYMVIGFAITLVVFFWALNQGQFKDQNRARFIPLEADVSTRPVKISRLARLEFIALFTLVGIGLATSAAVVAYAFFKAAG
jgi:cbb3-type cytochrome oxidase maturation protein